MAILDIEKLCVLIHVLKAIFPSLIYAKNTNLIMSPSPSERDRRHITIAFSMCGFICASVCAFVCPPVHPRVFG